MKVKKNKKKNIKHEKKTQKSEAVASRAPVPAHFALARSEV